MKNPCHGNKAVPSPDRQIPTALGEHNLVNSCELPCSLEKNIAHHTPQTILSFTALSCFYLQCQNSASREVHTIHFHLAA